MEPPSTLVLKPEALARLLWALTAAMFGLATIGSLADATLEDPGWWLFGLLIPLAITVAAVRALMMRIVADAEGVRILGPLSTRRYPWHEIDRIEISDFTGRASIVLATGKRRKLAGFRLSPAERFRGLPSHTGDVVESLQALLERSRTP